MKNHENCPFCGAEAIERPQLGGLLIAHEAGCWMTEMLGMARQVIVSPARWDARKG